MKYVLILYLCTFAGQPQCPTSTVPGVQFDNYYDCITEGYKYSYTRLKELPKEEIEEKLLAIKFECRKVEKPKINT